MCQRRFEPVLAEYPNPVLPQQRRGNSAGVDAVARETAVVYSLAATGRARLGQYRYGDLLLSTQRERTFGAIEEILADIDTVPGYYPRCTRDDVRTVATDDFGRRARHRQSAGHFRTERQQSALGLQLFKPGMM